MENLPRASFEVVNSDVVERLIFIAEVQFDGNFRLSFFFNFPSLL
jgi:hypothetical protein